MEEKYSYEYAFSKEDWIQNKIDDMVLEVIKQRKKKKISQLKLSKLVSVPQSSISRIETFRTVPSLQMLIKIGNALDLSLDFIPKQGVIHDY